MLHHRVELVGGDEPGDPLDAVRHVGAGDQRPGRDVVPLEQRGVAEEHRDDRDDVGAVGRADRLVRVLDLAELLDGLHEGHHVGAGQLGERLDVRPLGIQPQAEAAQPAAQAGHALGAQDQGALGDEPVHDRGDARPAAQRRAGHAPVGHRQAAGDAAVEQGQPGAVGIGAPRRPRAGQPGGVDDLADAGDLVEVLDDLPHLLDVLEGDGGQVGVAAVQHQPDQRPRQAEALLVADVPQRDQPFPQPGRLAAERQPDLVGDQPRLEDPDAEQPPPVQPQPPGQRQVNQVMPGVEVGPARGRIEPGTGRRAGVPGLPGRAIPAAAAAAGRPCRQVGIGAHEPPVKGQVLLRAMPR